MSEFSSLTGKFRAVPKESLHDSAFGKIAKRPRDSHVCGQCRRSKLRCDRNQPCGTCVKRGDAASCNYPRVLTSAKAENSNTTTRDGVAEDRLLHLESLVKQLMENQAPAQSSNLHAQPETPPHLASDPTHDDQSDEDESTKYVGSTHWSAILDDIHELKAVLGNATEVHQAAGRPVNAASVALPGHREVIFGSPDKYSLEHVLSQYLPPRLDVDRLLSTFFQGETFIVPFIHAYRFQRQYRDFWVDTASAHPLWVSMLFSICCIANLIRAAQGTSSPGTQLTSTISDLHTAAGQCLVLGEYYRPQPLAVEALGLYAQCKNLRTLDPSREAGAILGIVVRMAYEMGYHRDPDSYGSFTVFESELRRRCWSALQQMDVMISFQLGLPSNITLENCDTKSPRNLLDSDFDEDTEILPPSRSENETIRILWFIVKERQMPSFSKVCQDALSFREKSDSEVLQLDREIQQMFDTIPEALRTRPLSESIADPSFVIMTRLFVEYIYLKSLLVLHRRYMARGVVSSTHSCVSAGKRLVSQFIAMYREFAPGGQLYTQRWMLTNFTMNDFLLGVMVLCLVVHIRRKSILSNFQSCIDAATESEVLELLEQAHAICLEKSDASKDARRVARAVRLILNGARLSSPQPANPSTSGMQSISIDNSEGGVDLANLTLQPQAGQPYFPEVLDLPFGHLDPFNFMGNDFDNVDWMAFEPQMSGQATSPLYMDQP